MSSEARIRSLEFQLSVCRSTFFGMLQTAQFAIEGMVMYPDEMASAEVCKSTFVDVLQTAQLAIEGIDTWPDEMTSEDCKNSKYAPRECACEIERERNNAK